MRFERPDFLASLPDSPPQQQLSLLLATTMKFSTVLTAAVVAVVCVLQPTVAEEQASIHLRVHSEQSPNGAICYKACPSGQYCPRGENACRAPTGNQCFNPATSLFRQGCDAGFKCSGGKCVYN